MACLDHECVECGYSWMDNAHAYMCAKCGGRVTNTFDEDIDRSDALDDGRIDDEDSDAPFDGEDDAA